MSGQCGCGNVGTAYDSGAFAPKNKFLCSYGGKILPRPTDGLLKYVGGETRVIATPRDITFSELMQKVTALIDSDMVLKYQPFQEDLDALVSVRSDEDVKHMLNECDHYENGGGLMLRAFLFPSTPLVLEHQTANIESQLLEQCYIDAINGIIRMSSMSRVSPVRALTSSSACSSPKSYSSECRTIETVSHESYSGSCSSPTSMTLRGRSRSGIDSPTSQCCHCSNGNGSPSFKLYDYGNQHHNLHHQNHPPHGGNLSIRLLPPDPQLGVGSGRQFSPNSMGKGSPYHPTSRHSRRNGGCSRVGCHDDRALERAYSLPLSPRYLIYE